MEGLEEKKREDQQINKESLVSWLQENIEPAQESQLSLDAICKAVDTCNSCAVGRIIQKVFPNVVVQKKRCKDDWTTIAVIYKGISWRTMVDIPANIEFKDISHYAKDFFVMNETADSVTLGHILNFMINFNKVIIEIHFQRNLQWFLSLCGRTEIKPQQFGMNNCFKLEKNSIAGIMDGIRTLRVCHGLDSEHKFSSDYKDDIIKEIFTTLKEENSKRTVFRLLNCNRVLNFRAHLSVNICPICKGALEKKQSDSYQTDMTEPSMSNIPIDHSYIIGYKKARKSNVENICDNSNSEGTCKQSGPSSYTTQPAPSSDSEQPGPSSRVEHHESTEEQCGPSTGRRVSRVIYLDYNATTPLEAEVIHAVTESLTDAWGNPSSSHDAGIKAKQVIDEARHNVATMIGAKSTDIIFTSGGTEGNNTILQTAVKYFSTYHDICNGHQGGDNPDKLPHFITSNLEHDSVKLVLEHLAEEGIASVTFVPASSKTGYVDVQDVLSAVRPSTCMITIMLANNETGVLQPIKQIGEEVRQLNLSRKTLPKILLHTDAAQAIGKIEVDVEDLGIDYLTIVGHKFYAPRIGAIYVRDLGRKDLPLYPVLYGGGQERNYRPGTENTPMIAGLGKAAELVVKNVQVYSSHMSRLRDYLEDKLQEVFKDRVHFNGKFSCSERLPNTCNVSIIGDHLEGHRILSHCKLLQASIGAACHSQNRPSPILLAIGVPESIAKNALRLSIGRETTLANIDCIIQDLQQAVNEIENNQELN